MCFKKKGGERKYCNMSCSNIRRGSLGHLTDNINRAGPHTGDTRCNQHFAQSTQDYNNQRPYMEITRSPLPQNNSNLPLPFFCCNYPIFLLDNIYWWLYMYINWFTLIIFFMIVHVIQKFWRYREFFKLSQRNGKLPLPRRKQGNYPEIPIYYSDKVRI